MIECSRCKKQFEEEKYYWICPKCGLYNRKDAATELEHQMLHDKYDHGYEHTEQDNHQNFHDTYDNGYQHGEQDEQKAVEAAIEEAAGNAVAGNELQGREDNVKENHSGRKSPLHKVIKIILIIFIIQFIFRIWLGMKLSADWIRFFSLL